MKLALRNPKCGSGLKLCLADMSWKSASAYHKGDRLKESD